MSAGATTGESGGELALDGGVAPRAEVSRLSDYVALTKPRITLMVAVTAALGYATADGNGWAALVSVLTGVVLACMGSAALNQAYEREADARMHRTRRRPVAAGRMSTGEGIVVVEAESKALPGASESAAVGA
ncbi:MAG: UbiA family prenyltransferase, partial [Planctomycetota bacterium]